MTQRYFKNWLQAYIDYTQHLEAPTAFHFWSGISAIAGALRRRVWLDMGYFQWSPNFYIILVAKPGIVQKSTSSGIAADILRDVEGIKFGPSSLTWQALVQSMAQSAEAVDLGGGVYRPMSCITIVASELGTLLDPHNRELVDVLTDLWDGKTGSWERKTKTSGHDIIENPWINIIACTTPAWMAQNMPEVMLGGGFASRCVFVYAETKRHLCAYPQDHIPPDFAEQRKKLLHDLELISMLKGSYTLSPDAKAFGEKWYSELHTNIPAHLTEERYGGYVARKQTHVHKIAMVLSAAARGDMLITVEDLQTSIAILDAVERDMHKIYSRIGKAPTSIHFDQLLEYLQRAKSVKDSEAVRYMLRFCDPQTCFQLIDAGVRANVIRRVQYGPIVKLEYVE